MNTNMRPRPRWHRHLHHPSAFLLAAQLLSLLLSPLMDDTHSGRVLLGAVGLVDMFHPSVNPRS